MLYWWSKYVLLGPLLRLVFRPTIEGREHVPQRGGAILASNHLAVADSFFLPLFIPRPVTFLAKREYFTQKGLLGFVKRTFFTGMNQVPVDRTVGSAAQAAMDTAIRLLREEKVLGIYPEGTRSPDGRLYKGKTGVARLALRCKVPVLACAMVGTKEIQPIGQVKPNIFRPITIRISPPMDFCRYYDDPSNPKVLRQITDEIMFTLRELSGQEYVHEYAKRKSPDEVMEPESTPVLSGPPLEAIA